MVDFDIEAGVGDVENTYLYNIDDLQAIVNLLLLTGSAAGKEIERSWHH